MGGLFSIFILHDGQFGQSFAMDFGRMNGGNVPLVTASAITPSR
jgi:hypothetical protein